MRPKVQLILRSADINTNIQNNASGQPSEPTTDYTNSNGDFISRYRTRMNFNRINLRALLGSIYERDARYMIKLESVTFHLSSNLSLFSTYENDRCFNIYMSGLPFIRSWNNEAVMNDVLIASVRVPTGAQAYTILLIILMSLLLKYSLVNTTKFTLLKSRYVIN